MSLAQDDVVRIGNLAVKAAQRQNLKNGVVNVYSKNNKLYFQLPNKQLTNENPFDLIRTLEKKLGYSSDYKNRLWFNLKKNCVITWDAILYATSKKKLLKQAEKKHQTITVYNPNTQQSLKQTLRGLLKPIDFSAKTKHLHFAGV